VLNSEGDPSLGILLVPVGALLLVIALVRVALAPRPRWRDGTTGVRTSS